MSYPPQTIDDLILLATTPITSLSPSTKVHSDLLRLAENQPPLLFKLTLPPCQNHAKVIAQSLQARLEFSDERVVLRTLHLLELLIRHAPFLPYISHEGFFTHLWRHVSPRYNRRFTIHLMGKSVSGKVSANVRLLVRAWAEALISGVRDDDSARFWIDKYVTLSETVRFPTVPADDGPWVCARGEGAVGKREIDEKVGMGMLRSVEEVEETVALFERLIEGKGGEELVDENVMEVLAKCDDIGVHFEELKRGLGGGHELERVRRRLERAMEKWRRRREIGDDEQLLF